MIKKILILLFTFTLFANASYAEKVECELLSPIQKAIYKAYCQAEAKKAGNNNSNAKKNLKTTGEKAKSILGAIKGKIKLNTDSTLFKTGKHSEK